MTPLRIGLAADNAAQLATLSHLVNDSGHCVGVGLLLDSAVCSEDTVDAWIVESGGDSCHLLDNWLGSLNVPVIVGSGDCPVDNSSDYPAWARRMQDKIERLNGSINLHREDKSEIHGEQIDSIWVLAASTGGPAAVREFFSALPPGLGVAFVYVQHIDTGFEQTLTETLSRAGSYRAYIAAHGELLRPDAIAVIKPERLTELLPNGTFALRRESWAGPYKPSADQFSAQCARTFAERCNLIVFSGMESDGAIASRLIKQRGGRVWVQSPASCVSPSMPESVLATGCVEFSGTIEKLAERLVQSVRQRRNYQYGKSL